MLVLMQEKAKYSHQGGNSNHLSWFKRLQNHTLSQQ